MLASFFSVTFPIKTEFGAYQLSLSIFGTYIVEII